VKTSFIIILLLCASSLCHARTSFRGPGGLISTPTAYLAAGGIVGPRPSQSGPDETITALSYAYQDLMELGMCMASNQARTLSFKCQVQKDTKNKGENAPAAALGYLDLDTSNGGEAYYAVLSKKAEQYPLVLHFGVLSPRSVFGDMRLFGGFEMPLSEQVVLVSEFDGLEGEINSGVEYYFSPSTASYLYFMDVGDRGLQSQSIAGLSFRMTF